MSIMLSPRFRDKLVKMASDRMDQAMEIALRSERAMRDEFPRSRRGGSYPTSAEMERANGPMPSRTMIVNPTRAAVERVMSEMADDRMNQPVLDEGNGEDRTDLDPNFARRLDIE